MTAQPIATLAPVPRVLRLPAPARGSTPGLRRIGLAPVSPVGSERTHPDRGAASDQIASGRRPDLRAWAGRYVVLALEIAQGLRPPAQLLNSSSVEVYESLRRRHQIYTRLAQTSRGRTLHPGGTARVVSLRLARTAEDAVEATAVTLTRGRGRAIAMRIEWRHDEDPDVAGPRPGRPVVVALELG